MTSQIKAVVLVAAIVALLAGLALFGRTQKEAGRAEVRGEWNVEKVEQHRAAILAQTKNEAESKRRIAQQKETQDEQAKRLAQALADNDALRASGQRMRDQQARAIAASRRCVATADTASADSVQAAEEAARVLADVQRRLDEASDGIARFADQSHEAGVGCELVYDSLTK